MDNDNAESATKDCKLYQNGDDGPSQVGHEAGSVASWKGCLNCLQRGYYPNSGGRVSLVIIVMNKFLSPYPLLL